MHGCRCVSRWWGGVGCLLVMLGAASPAAGSCPATVFGGARTLLNRVPAGDRPGTGRTGDRPERWEAFELAVDGILGSDGTSADPSARQRFIDAIRTDATVELPCSRDLVERDRLAQRLAMVGYSAKDIAAVLLKHTTKALLDDAYARRMAGLHAPDAVVATPSPWTQTEAPATDAVSTRLPVPVPPAHSVDRGVARAGTAPRSGVPRPSEEVAVPLAHARSGSRAPAVETLVAHAREMARAQGVDVRLVEAIIRQESNWNPASISKKGAVGLMQLMPATAALLGVDAHDPLDNIRGGVTYLADLIRAYGDVRHALIAYNAGPAHANRVIRGERTLYAETRRYLAAIAENYPL